MPILPVCPYLFAQAPTPLLAWPTLRLQDVLRGGCQGVLQPGCVLLADKQTGGKGRGGNQWVSPDGCLMFSASRQVAILGEQAPFINYLVCLAVLRGIKATLQQLYPARTPPDLGIRIKWPNDIYHAPPASPAAALKIGGALIHTSWSGSGFKVVVGIGLNLTNNQPTTCLQQLLEQAHSSQESGASGREPDTCPVISRELLLANVVSHLDECFSVFEQHGFAPLEPDYLSSWMHSGQLVTTQGKVQTGAGTVPTAGGSGRPGEEADGGDSVTLRLRGLSSSGFLLAEEVEGDHAGQHGTRLWELTPDGNSLDMMAGLLRRKV
ncbi:hypothetical protein QJQ45_001102 [Haematococcus lacustris]|nr:hypothetical protein QJQ45_001102 [Haematococcus lacustris]